jgi:hypothetical protein
MIGDGDPDDAALPAMLKSGSAAAWRELAELDEDFRARPHADDDCVWPSVGDGRTPYPVYGARVEAACRLLGELGAVTPAYHWNRRRPPALRDDGTVSVADAVRLATTIVRSERFGDGRIGAAVNQGVLQAVVAALAAWRRSQAD